jgi:hypothetical protein
MGMISCARYGGFPAASGPKSFSARLRTKSRIMLAANEYIMKPFDKDIVEEKFQEIGLI